MGKFLKSFAVTALVLGMTWSLSTAQAVWDNRNPVTQSNQLYAVSWIGSQYVAVGAAGTIVTSPDAITWTTRTSGAFGTTLTGVAGNGSTLVVVGQGGLILRSTDAGVTWNTLSTVNAGSNTKSLAAVVWSGTQYVAVGSGGIVLNSTDGSTWTQRASGLTDGDISAIAFASGRFVAVGAYTSGNGAITSTDGVNWTQGNAGASLYGVTWAGTEFIGVGNGGIIRGSSDGITWSTRTTSVTTSLLSVALGSRLVAVGLAGTLKYSGDGTTWTSATSPTTQNLLAVAKASNGSGFVAVGGAGVVLTSPDGQTWTQTSSVYADMNAVTARFNPSVDTMFVAVGTGGTILTSSNGTTWTKQDSKTGNTLYSVTWTGTVLVAGGENGTIVTSSNGSTWTASSISGTVGTVWGVAGNNANVIAVGDLGGAGAIAYSTNSGTSFSAPTTTPSPAPGPLYGITYVTGTTYVAVGGADGGTTVAHIRRTTNSGASWSVVGAGLVSPSTNRLNAVSTNGTTLVAVGTNGVLLTAPSPGTTWTATGAGSVTDNLNAVTNNATTFAVVGNAGRVLTAPSSTLPLSWTPQSSGATVNLNGIKWDGRQFTAVGAGGKILTSSPSALPPAPVPNAPASGTLNVPVSPLVSWFAASGANSYTLQVSLSSAFASLLVDTVVSGLSLQVGSLVPGTKYYWRVRTNGGTGSSAYSATNDFTVISADSSAPILSAPAANATDVSLTPVGTWQAFTGAVSYRIQLSTDSGFAALLLNDSTVTGTFSLLGSLDTNKAYYWRVNAKLATGLSAWSTRRKFTTTGPVPAVPSLVSPANGTNGFALTGGVLAWSNVAGATRYEVQVSTSSGFESFVKDTLLSATSLSLPTLNASALYYWRVNAQNGGGSSAYSSVRNFTPATTPAKPTLNAPANNATGVDVFTDLTWFSVTAAATYQVQLSTDSNFVTSFLNDSTISGSTLARNAGQLANSTRYYWRVGARNPAGFTWSDKRTFQSGNLETTAPAAPALATPANFVTNVASASVAFSWAAPATARYYRLEVSLDPLFSTLLVNDSMIATSKTITTLNGGLEYYWRVKAGNKVGYGPYSEVRAFSTVATIPVVPVLTAPAQFAVDVAVLPTLTWGSVVGATYYKVELSTSSGFETKLLNDSVTTTSRTLTSSLTGNINYYWRVRAGNPAGISDYSTPFRFTTGALPIPGAPNLVSPLQFATGVSAGSVALVWSKVAAATAYKLQLSTSPSFADLVLQDSTITDTVRTITNLSGGSEYYWRVYSRNSAGTSAPSGTYRFTTGTTAIRQGMTALWQGAGTNGGFLRFGLSERQHVTIRLFNTRGRSVMQAYDAVLEAGYHSIPLPADLNGSFYIVDFRAGALHQVLKMHP